MKPSSTSINSKASSAVPSWKKNSIYARLALVEVEYEVGEEALERLAESEGVGFHRIASFELLADLGFGGSGLLRDVDLDGQAGPFFCAVLLHHLGIVDARVGVREHGFAQAVGAPAVEGVGPLGVLDDADDEHEDGREDEGVAMEGAEEDGGGSEELEEEADEVAAPELVVLDGEGGDGVRAAEVEEEERRPEGKDDGAVAAAVAAAAADIGLGGDVGHRDGGGRGGDVAQGVEKEAEGEVGDPFSLLFLLSLFSYSAHLFLFSLSVIQA
ncbi:hypothetical protein ACMD2_17917 [Ananas comosus]|uniref:Uncharacterized protein n=1 Tax=Ananas comosus TaxID=4615 RepID=A0A199UJP7_ANACO|nr:hypothetical protein ACMD2_17917 [Ananas comosus]